MVFLRFIGCLLIDSCIVGNFDCMDNVLFPRSVNKHVYKIRLRCCVTKRFLNYFRGGRETSSVSVARVQSPSRRTRSKVVVR